MAVDVPLRARGRRAVVSLVAADCVSLTGNRMSLLAVPWFVLTTTGSPGQAGVVAFAAFLPMAVAAFFGGHIVDRVGGRLCSVVADVCSAVTTGLIPLLYSLDLLSFPVLVALVFLGTVFDGPGATGRRALLPEAATAAGWRLEAVTSASEAAYRFSQIAGGLLTAALIAAFDAPTAMWVNAATFLFSAVVVGAGVAGISVRHPAPPPFGESMREGVDFVRRDSLLQAVIVLFVAINMLENALVAVLLPTFAVGVDGGAAALGVPIAALGVGALLGSVLYGRFGKRLRLSATLFWSLVLSGPPKYLALAVGAPLPVIAVAFFVASLVAGPVNPMLSAVQLRRIPAPLRGRVLGAIMCGVVATIPLAVLIAGWLAEQVPLTGVLFGGAVIYALAAVFGAATRPLRQHSSPQNGT